MVTAEVKKPPIIGLVTYDVHRGTAYTLCPMSCSGKSKYRTDVSPAVTTRVGLFIATGTVLVVSD